MSKMYLSSFFITRFFFLSSRPYTSSSPKPCFALHQVSSFSKMNHSRQTPRSRVQLYDYNVRRGHSSGYSKDSSSQFGNPQPTVSRKETPIYDTSDEQNWPSLGDSGKVSSSTTKKSKHTTTLLKSGMGNSGMASINISSSQDCDPVLDTKKPGFASDSASVMGHGGIPVTSGPRQPDVHAVANQADSEVGPLKHGRVGVVEKEVSVCSSNITNRINNATKADIMACPFQFGSVPMVATQANNMAGPSRSARDGYVAMSSSVVPQNVVTSVPKETCPVYPAHSGSVLDTSKNRGYGVMGTISQHNETPTKKQAVSESVIKSVSKIGPSKNNYDKVTRNHSPGNSKKVIPQTTKNPPKEYRASCSDHIRPFDICQPRDGISRPASSPLEKNKEIRNYFELLKNDPRPSFLRPGMVLLKNYISCADQIKIVKICRKLGIGPGGFYQPCFSNGAKLRLYMMCLGKDWDPQKKSYGNSRFIDGASPPVIPVEFKIIVSGAIQASRAVVQDHYGMKRDYSIPWMKPDICIVNFYTESGKLGMHQDRDESSESILNGLPVVSFSIGDSAEFLYGDERDVNKAEKVELKSGDVLIFGGESRQVFHGVTGIIPDSAPKFLANEAFICPGRMNLTFREY